ncbi:DoxX family protein [Plantibacter sp. M259]|uniref:DoxX family protein n=1 Tax=Plantibacter sp. M259 TaxID=2583822 RepID=UPI0011103ABB|nr:DoxX family protein [Plantibacter sp. M259]
MTIAFFITAGLAALAFVGSGVLKVVRPSAALRASGLTWVDDFSDQTVKLIGVAEVLGGLGLILPILTGIAPWLSPIAGVALTALMIGAVVVDARHRLTIVPALALAILAVAAGILGFLIVD